MRREAAAALAEVLRDDEKCIRVVASDVPDDVGVLVKLLECPDAHRLVKPAHVQACFLI